MLSAEVIGGIRVGRMAGRGMAGNGDERLVAMWGRGNLTRSVRSTRVYVQNGLQKQASKHE